MSLGLLHHAHLGFPALTQAQAITTPFGEVCPPQTLYILLTDRRADSASHFCGLAG